MVTASREARRHLNPDHPAHQAGPVSSPLARLPVLRVLESGVQGPPHVSVTPARLLRCFSSTTCGPWPSRRHTQYKLRSTGGRLLRRHLWPWERRASRPPPIAAGWGIGDLSARPGGPPASRPPHVSACRVPATSGGDLEAASERSATYRLRYGVCGGWAPERCASSWCS